jgi:hypothetical protein
MPRLCHVIINGNSMTPQALDAVIADSVNDSFTGAIRSIYNLPDILSGVSKENHWYQTQIQANSLIKISGTERQND